MQAFVCTFSSRLSPRGGAVVRFFGGHLPDPLCTIALTLQFCEYQKVPFLLGFCVVNLHRTVKKRIFFDRRTKLFKLTKRVSAIVRRGSCFIPSPRERLELFEGRPRRSFNGIQPSAIEGGMPFTGTPRGVKCACGWTFSTCAPRRCQRHPSRLYTVLPAGQRDAFSTRCAHGIAGERRGEHAAW